MRRMLAVALCAIPFACSSPDARRGETKLPEKSSSASRSPSSPRTPIKHLPASETTSFPVSEVPSDFSPPPALDGQEPMPRQSPPTPPTQPRTLDLTRVQLGLLLLAVSLVTAVMLLAGPWLFRKIRNLLSRVRLRSPIQIKDAQVG